MQLNLSYSALILLACLFCLTSSLPLSPRKIFWLEPLARRATYSVVPVDGGSTAGSPLATSTIVSTIIQTPAPKTIVETDSIIILPITDYIVSTKTIDLDQTQTDFVTVTPPPKAVTVTTTGSSIINVNPSSVTIVVTATASSPTTPTTIATFSSTFPTTVITSSVAVSTSQSSSSAERVSASTTLTSASQISSSSHISSISLSTSKSSSFSSTLPPTTTSVVANATSSYVQLTSTSIAPTPSSSFTYDDGQWHTSYPAWSNSTVPTGTPKIFSATSTLSGKLIASTPMAGPKGRGLGHLTGRAVDNSAARRQSELESPRDLNPKGKPQQNSHRSAFDSFFL